MFLIGEVSGLVENFNIGIFSGTLNVINVNLCMVALFMELYLFILLLVTDHISRAQQYQTISSKNFIFLSKRRFPEIKGEKI